MNLIPLGISAASLGLSLTAFVVSLRAAWITTLSPAQLSINFGLIGVGLVGEKREAIIVIPVSIVNEGAKAEIITDVVLIEHQGAKAALFANWITTKPDELELFFKPTDSANGFIKSIYNKIPFAVAPKSEITKGFVFQPYKTPPVFTSDSPMEYEIVFHGINKTWHFHNAVKWPPGTAEHVQKLGAVLTDVQSSIEWKHKILKDIGFEGALLGSKLGDFDFR